MLAHPKGKNQADFAGQDGAKLVPYTALASVQPVDCLFRFADSKLTANHCGNVEHEKLFILLLYFDALRISWFLIYGAGGFVLLERERAIRGLLQRHSAAQQSPLCTSDTDTSGLKPSSRQASGSKWEGFVSAVCCSPEPHFSCRRCQHSTSWLPGQ